MLPKDIIFEISYYCDFLTKHRFKLVNKNSYQVIKIIYIPKKYEDELNNNILKNYSHLKFLVLSSSFGKFTDDSIRHMTTLLSLDISYCSKITDGGIKHMTELRYLDISNTKITNEGIKHMGELRYLDISDTKITNDVIKHMTELRYLDISNTKITDDGIQHMRNLNFLSACEHCNITSKGVKYMNLHTLVIEGNYFTLDTFTQEDINSIPEFSAGGPI